MNFIKLDRANLNLARIKKIMENNPGKYQLILKPKTSTER